MTSGARGGSQVARLGKRLRDAVDEGAETAERIHKKVADLPLELMERNGLLETSMREIRHTQEGAIAKVYELVRDINHSVVRLAVDLLEPRPARRARRKPPARPASRARPAEPAASARAGA